MANWWQFAGYELLAEHNALNVVGTTSGSIAGDQRGTHLRISLGRFELSRHSGEKTGENKLLFDADYGVIRAGHADVGLICGAPWQDSLVCSGYVRVSAEEGRDAAIKVPAEGYFFAGGFAVQIEQDDLGGDLAEELVGFAKGIVAARHEDAALKVHDGVALARREVTLIDAEAGGSDGVICWSDDATATDV
jgi:hypothetical protein